MKAADKVIVVTGGGGGIGRMLVLKLVQSGARVAAVDLNENALRETVDRAGDHQDKVSVHVADVSDQHAAEALPGAVIEAHGAVDGLINNAGIIQPFVRLNSLPYESIDWVIKVNLYGVIYMTKAFLPHLLERPVGHIVNVSSMGGFFPFPGQTLYGASKAAVKLLTEGLYSELKDTNVRVTTVFPGAIDTDIAKNSGVALPTDVDSSAFPKTSPERAADAIIDGMERDRFQVYIGKDARLMNLLYRLYPRWATDFMYHQMKALLPD